MNFPLERLSDLLLVAAEPQERLPERVEVWKVVLAALACGVDGRGGERNA